MTRVILLCLMVSSNFLRFQIVQSDRVSSKLDFGQDTHPVIHIKSPGVLTNADDSKNSDTTVTCSKTGCNKTITEDGEKDIVSDVVVHVKTLVNVPKSKNETIEETPDIPIVLGYGNSNNPEIISDLENNYATPVYESKFQPQLRRKYYEPINKQYAWTPRGGAPSINPVEFKRFEKPAWNRRQWSSGFVGPAPSRTSLPSSGYTTCTCHNPGLNWYPTSSTWSIQQPRHSNTHIDDKLAPLN
ncbi:hypothetical protein Trydic_g11933 [Trypoxylus dichotomus]